IQAQAIETAKINQNRAVQAAAIARDQALQTAGVEREQAIEVANRQKEIAVAQQQALRARAEQESLEAQAKRETAAQQVVTVERLAEADRDAQKQIIAAKAGIERDKIRRQTDAQIVAFTKVTTAEAEREAAEKQ